jgi:aspartyl-tRNA(Asn)/glutamyl-tRNA(Gln) amidotransferase subunit A
MNELLTVAELAPGLRQKKISSIELVQECLARIEKRNSELNAFITVMADSALADAHAAEDEIHRGLWRGPLHGIPIAIKDLIDTAGTRTTAASALYKDRIPAEDATVVKRLRDAGAIIIGKNNLHEFAYGGSSLISYFGEVRNPRDASRIAGGSSGGSAAAVVAGMAYAAIGTDTAGSVREPAAACGCVGLKPTYGRVSSRGVIALSPSLDHVGPLTMSVQDAAIVLQAIAGYDPEDLTSANVPVADYVSALKEDVKSLRLGVPRQFFFDDVDEDVAAAVEEALRVLKTLVASIKDVSLEVPSDRTLQAAESWACHAENAAKTPELYQPETLRRLRTGENISAAEYIRHRRELEEARRNIARVFADVDVLATPAVPIPAPVIAQLKSNPEQLRPAELKLLRNTRPLNVWGLPAISVPCGFTKDGLPIGLQIAAPHWREDLVLRVAAAYERAASNRGRQLVVSEGEKGRCHPERSRSSGGAKDLPRNSSVGARDP